MKNIAFLCIGLTTLGLATGYALSSLWGWVSVIIALGLLWLGGQWRAWHQVTALLPIFVIGLIAVGMLQDISAGWLLFSIVAALVAWDLRYFVGRLQQARLEDTARLQRVHLQRLLIVAGLGLFLAAMALNLQFELNLGWGIFLGALVIVGLSQVVSRVNQESN